MRPIVSASLVFAIVSCHGGSVEKPAPDPDLVCAPEGEVMRLQQVATYRRLTTKAELDTLRAAIEKRPPQPTHDEGMWRKAREALASAVIDLRPELKECIRKADPIVPNLEYVLRMRVSGWPGVGSFVEHVSFRRIESDKHPEATEAKTNADACVERIISMLELPPSQPSWEMMVPVRYDDCTPKTWLAKANAVRYATTAFQLWSAAHPNKKCPERIEELIAMVGQGATANDPWGRPYKLICGAALPPGVSGIGVVSVGRDGKAGTNDDIESWNDQAVTRDPQR